MSPSVTTRSAKTGENDCDCFCSCAGGIAIAIDDCDIDAAVVGAYVACDDDADARV
jgi:hypothetical protein